MWSEVFTPEIISQIIVSLLCAGAVYGGIRSDLKHMQYKIEQHDEAFVNTNQRIDRVLERRATPRTE